MRSFFKYTFHRREAVWLLAITTTSILGVLGCRAFPQKFSYGEYLIEGLYALFCILFFVNYYVKWRKYVKHNKP